MVVTNKGDKMALNVALLKKVKKHILAEPKRINMNTWGRDSDEGEPQPACGTVGCIAGWIVFLSKPKSKWDFWKSSDIRSEATRLLRMKDWQVDGLFSPYGVYGEPGTRDHAKSVAKRIDYFIKGHKK
jgi:hypothetical protein